MVRVDGEDEALADAIVARLEEQGLVEQAASNPGAVERAAADYLRSQGYLRARVTAGAPLFEEATAIVPLSVDAGPAFSIASIAFAGATRLAEDARLEAVALTDGAPYDAVAVDCRSRPSRGALSTRGVSGGDGDRPARHPGRGDRCAA